MKQSTKQPKARQEQGPATPVRAAATAGEARRKRALRLKAILVPTDFAKTSETALPFAAALAETFGAEVTLVHSLELWLYASFALAATYDPKTAACCKEKLEQFARRALPPGCRVKTLVLRGNPGLEIAAAARTLKSDLIIVATQGHTDLKHAWIGSVAERVVRHAPCPVLTVRA